MVELTPLTTLSTVLAQTIVNTEMPEGNTVLTVGLL